MSWRKLVFFRRLGEFRDGLWAAVSFKSVARTDSTWHGHHPAIAADTPKP
jgi:hypothetical protein